MKKKLIKSISFAFIIIFSLIMSTKANTNTLILTSDEDQRIVYNDKDFNKSFFLNHTEMFPGADYIDELIIKNQSTTEYQLFLKLNFSSTNEYDKDFLSAITIKFYLDDILILEDNLLALTENDNVEESINLGTFKENDVKNLKVNTLLDPEWGISKMMEDSLVIWQFYASWDNQFIEIEAPNTGLNNQGKSISFIFLFVGVILLCIFIYKEVKKR